MSRKKGKRASAADTSPAGQDTPDAAPEGPAEGAAFPLVVKVLAGAVVAGVFVSGARIADQLLSPSLSNNLRFCLVVLLVTLVVCFVFILRSRTSITATHVRQTWIVDKEVALSEVTQARLIYVPHLAWLIAPRLILRAGGRGTYTFYAAEPAVLRAFWRLAVARQPGMN
jgi:hypothetical protein